MYRMKFGCLLHESESQVTELTECKSTETSIRHICIIYINYSDTYLHQIAIPQVALNTKHAKV